MTARPWWQDPRWLVPIAVAVVAVDFLALGLVLGRDGSPSVGPEPTEVTTDASDPESPSPTSPVPSEPTASPTEVVTEPGPVGPVQLRGIWVHLLDRSLKTSAGITTFLDATADAGFNTVIVQGARRHDAFHDSGVLPRTTDDELEPGLDVLGEMVTGAHARGLQVHVWYSLAPSTHPSMQDEDLGPDHVNTRHGFGSGEPWVQAGNDPNYAYLDPAIPGYQDHVVAMLRDVVTRYAVDGVHLDYMRYECLQVTDSGGCATVQPGAPATANQHPVTMQRFAASGEGDLAAFMRTQTQDLVRRLYIEVAEVDPTVVVSAALIAQGDGPGADRSAFAAAKAYWNKGQDWASWVEEGIIDHAYPMAYFRESDPRWAQAYDDWVAFADVLDTDEHVVAIGQASYLNCRDASLGQLAEGAAAVDGVVVYSYQGDVAESCPGETRGDLLRALGAGMFAEPAAVPAVPRKTVPTAGHVLVEASDGQVVTLSGGTAQPIVRRTDATGHAGFVWVAPGEWQVSIDGGPASTVRVEAGEVTRVG